MDLGLPRDRPAAARPGSLSTSIPAMVGRWVITVQNEGTHAGRGGRVYLYLGRYRYVWKWTREIRYKIEKMVL